MQKQTKYNLSETNIANLGSDLEKKIKEAAANKEIAWKNCGKAAGLQIWRIEKFKVKQCPTSSYGTFYDGDSYIILYAYKNPKTGALSYDIHFWLGHETTQDEAGTAAYKTVELDDWLHGNIHAHAVQHREIEGGESAQFLSYFTTPIKILHGGIESGFRHVEPEKYEPRLLQLSGKKKIRVQQVPLKRESLHSGDVFILDTGKHIYQMNSSKSSGLLHHKGMQVATAIESDRKGLAKITVLDSENDVEPGFWSFFGGFGPIQSAEDAGQHEGEKAHGDKRLMKVSDSTGSLEFTEVAVGSEISKSLLNSDDVFILDNGEEVFAWIGKNSSKDEKRTALDFAHKYVMDHNLPEHTPISRLVEGGENMTFKQSLKA
ncbi:hypothetical protein PROFUN_04594 [Planoprotostelium fungivorum]|uniref:Gelsolin-like domain-containing protein n=1 Tax=Planoprotostelium fungivorum TaxID=1890364 RepID=A0A2P6NUB7_9EUKA|nr:hypothetical protein PROFUN_04594 [Planoprotostelium fungivorum]